MHLWTRIPRLLLQHMHSRFSAVRRLRQWGQDLHEFLSLHGPLVRHFYLISDYKIDSTEKVVHSHVSKTIACTHDQEHMIAPGHVSYGCFYT